jgi:tetratricopeptide (TPR) repeat protein
MPERQKILVGAAFFIVVALLSPQIVGAWYVNQANVAIAHIASVPQDSPQRLTDMEDAQNDLASARVFSNGDRLILALTRLLLDRGNAADAARTFDQASGWLQSDPIALFVWAEAAQESNQPAAAIDHWRMAGAYVYFSQQMHRAMDRHAWQVAEDYARVAVGIEPNSPDAHLVLGDAVSRREINDPESLNELDRARELASDPELLSTIISRKGEILASQDKDTQALDQFNQARALAPLDARPRTGYALTLLKLQPDATIQASGLLNQIVGDSPWYTAAYIALSNISETSGDVKSAESWLNQGLVRNPNNPELLFALGQFYARQHRFEEARATLVQALSFETRADNLELIAAALAGLVKP